MKDERSVPRRAFDAVRLGGPERSLYECPMCGLGVDRYDTVCRHCGHDVTAADALKHPESFESWRHHYLNGGLVRGPFPWLVPTVEARGRGADESSPPMGSTRPPGNSLDR